MKILLLFLSFFGLDFLLKTIMETEVAVNDDMGLLNNILKKIYYKNILRIIPNIDKTGFPD